MSKPKSESPSVAKGGAETWELGSDDCGYMGWRVLMPALEWAKREDAEDRKRRAKEGTNAR